MRKHLTCRNRGKDKRERIAKKRERKAVREADRKCYKKDKDRERYRKRKNMDRSRYNEVRQTEGVDSEGGEGRSGMKEKVHSRMVEEIRGIPASKRNSAKKKINRFQAAF